MMSYTSACTCLWSSAGMLMRRTSPSTRIIGGRPADRCRSDALFLTENANSSAISMHAPLALRLELAGLSPDSPARQYSPGPAPEIQPFADACLSVQARP